MRVPIGAALAISFVFFLGFEACSGRFVKRDELDYLHKKYNGTYIISQKIDVGNKDEIKAGTRVKLFFTSNSESVKVYAFKFNVPREQAIGKNILYLFETDFPDEEYDRQLFEKKLAALVRRSY